LGSSLEGRRVTTTGDLSACKSTWSLIRIYTVNTGAKQHNDTSLSWFRSWVVRPAGVRSGRCIAVHHGACRGELQARQEKRRSLRVPEVWLRQSANIVDEGRNMQVRSYPSSPHSRGNASSFYRLRRGSLQSWRMALVLHMAAWRIASWSWWLSWRISLLAGVVASPVCDNLPRKIPYYRLKPIHFGR
jgi:hypothetical protein